MNNPDLRKAIIKATDDVISQAPDQAPQRPLDQGFNIALKILGATIICSVFGVLGLMLLSMYHNGWSASEWVNLKIPQEIAALGTTAIGAVAGLVVSPSLKSSKP